MSKAVASFDCEYGYSCMGYEIAGGLGVKMARPGREVIVIVGEHVQPRARARSTAATCAPSCTSRRPRRSSQPSWSRSQIDALSSRIVAATRRGSFFDYGTMTLGLVRAAQGRDEEAERLLREAQIALKATGFREIELVALEAGQTLTLEGEPITLDDVEIRRAPKDASEALASDPTSGAAKFVSRQEKREIADRVRPLYMAADLEAIGMAAALLRIAGREVVRDDLILLAEGDRVPADAVLVDSVNLSVDESALTGESVPIEVGEGDVVRSDGDRGASTATGDSPLRPNIAWSRSACSVLVGSPVLGPPRCTSMTTSGSSVMIARPIASPLSAMPGPDELVIPSEPA